MWILAIMIAIDVLLIVGVVFAFMEDQYQKKLIREAVKQQNGTPPIKG